jgi:hypothetical protein
MSFIKIFIATSAFVISFTTHATNVVYSNNFDIGGGSEWSSSLWTSSGGSDGTHNFLGAWDDFSTTLSLDGLNRHASVSLSFDLYVIGTVFGNFDPAVWSVTAGDRINPNALEFSTTFSNIDGFSQAYPNAFPNGSNPAQSGSIAIDPFYYGMPNGLTAYHLDFVFEHTASDFLATFKGKDFLPYIGPTYGRWGLDNVKVAINTVPEPSSRSLVFGAIVLALAALCGRSRNPMPSIA